MKQENGDFQTSGHPQDRHHGGKAIFPGGKAPPLIMSDDEKARLAADISKWAKKHCKPQKTSLWSIICIVFVVGCVVIVPVICFFWAAFTEGYYRSPGFLVVLLMGAFTVWVIALPYRRHNKRMKQ